MPERPPKGLQAMPSFMTVSAARALPAAQHLGRCLGVWRLPSAGARVMPWLASRLAPSPSSCDSRRSGDPRSLGEAETVLARPRLSVPKGHSSGSGAGSPVPAEL